MQILKSILKSWRRNLFRPLVHDDFRTWRGIDLQIASWHLQKKLASCGDEQHVGVMLPTSGLFPVAATAIWSLGRTVVPLNYLLSSDEIAYIIKDAGLKRVITVQSIEIFASEKKNDFFSKRVSRGRDSFNCRQFTLGRQNRLFP